MDTDNVTESKDQYKDDYSFLKSENDTKSNIDYSRY